MKKGLLQFKGTIELDQFWPYNANSKYDSDADTVKVKILKNSFKFTNPSGKTKSTTSISKAGFWHYVKTKAGKTLKFKSVIDSKGYINMRLQGIDAPELHYSTGKIKYRQLMGETATVQLYKYLKSNTKNGSINCEVFTQVNKPNDVFDIYGRCVGDIIIMDKKGKSINVNHWLVENGFAFPAFYNSMTHEEIREIIKLTKKVITENKSSGKKIIWKYYSEKLNPLDRKLTHDKNNTNYNASADNKYPIIFPKMFRRLWSFEIQNKQIYTHQDFYDFLKTKKDDVCCNTSDFLKNKEKYSQLSNFIDDKGNINFKPYDIVIKEGGTTLKDNKGNKILKF